MKARTSAASVARRPYFFAVAEKESGFPMYFALMVNLRLILSAIVLRT
jgi:hypothetical protein